jgi:hypothetical protein
VHFKGSSDWPLPFGAAAPNCNCRHQIIHPTLCHTCSRHHGQGGRCKSSLRVHILKMEKNLQSCSTCVEFNTSWKHVSNNPNSPIFTKGACCFLNAKIATGDKTKPKPTSTSQKHAHPKTKPCGGGTHRAPFLRFPFPLKDACCTEVGASHASP